MFMRIHLQRAKRTKQSEWSKDLYSYYETHMEKMPEQYLKQLQKGEMPEIAVCDYIAGMTDNFAVKSCKKFLFHNLGKF